MIADFVIRWHWQNPQPLSCQPNSHEVFNFIIPRNSRTFRVSHHSYEDIIEEERIFDEIQSEEDNEVKSNIQRSPDSSNATRKSFEKIFHYP